MTIEQTYWSLHATLHTAESTSRPSKATVEATENSGTAEILQRARSQLTVPPQLLACHEINLRSRERTWMDVVAATLVAEPCASCTSGRGVTCAPLSATLRSRSRLSPMTGGRGCPNEIPKGDHH